MWPLIASMMWKISCVYVAHHSPHSPRSPRSHSHHSHTLSGRCTADWQTRSVLRRTVEYVEFQRGYCLCRHAEIQHHFWYLPQVNSLLAMFWSFDKSEGTSRCAFPTIKGKWKSFSYLQHTLYLEDKQHEDHNPPSRRMADHHRIFKQHTPQ